MSHIALVLTGVNCILADPADDAVQQEILSAMLISIAHHFHEHALLHEVDAHGNL